MERELTPHRVTEKGLMPGTTIGRRWNEVGVAVRSNWYGGFSVQCLLVLVWCTTLYLARDALRYLTDAQNAMINVRAFGRMGLRGRWEQGEACTRVDLRLILLMIIDDGIGLEVRAMAQRRLTFS